MAAKWLNRDLIVGPYLALALSEKDFQAALRHCKVPPAEWAPWVSQDADATTHVLRNPDGGMACVVTIRDCEGKEGVQIAAMLVHESVHVWQMWRESIGESEPSKEFEAYSIQAIAQRLMTASRAAKEPSR
jgi:hypothetical protein